MNAYQIVADESVDFRIVRNLRNEGWSVFAVVETAAAIKDKEVLDIAVQHNTLLITEDKDFGELVFRLKLPHTGILLIRIFILSDTEKLSLVTRTITEHYQQLLGRFSVISDHLLRIKE